MTSQHTSAAVPPAVSIQRQAPPARRPALTTAWAHHADEVRAAQRLRYRVFAQELGARLASPLPGHDVDRFDDFCEHLLVRDGATREVVGTYRVLTPAQARRAGGTYSDGEFDLAPLDALRPRMVELGRSCVHPDHRHGGVILALWGALAQFMRANALDTMIGCASIALQPGARAADGSAAAGGLAAASIWHQLRLKHLAAPEWRVQPRLALPVDGLPVLSDVAPPALIQGYLRLGTRVLGPPAWDPDFNTADLPMLMRMEDLPDRYRRGFAGAGTESASDGR